MLISVSLRSIIHSYRGTLQDIIYNLEDTQISVSLRSIIHSYLDWTLKNEYI